MAFVHKLADGDIIVFRYPLDMGEKYVKRVIGVPGGRLDIGITSRSNPPELPEQARAMLRSHVVNGEFVVPDGPYSAMSDNPSNSRYWGYVPRENIVGTQWVVYWSYDAPTEELVRNKLSHFVDLGLHFFQKPAGNVRGISCIETREGGTWRIRGHGNSADRSCKR